MTASKKKSSKSQAKRLAAQKPNELPLGLIDVPSDKYHADRSAVSKGWLDKIDRSPAHLKVYLDGFEKETPTLVLGRLVHTAVLEPDLLASEYVTAPDINRRTKVGKAEYAEWEKENQAKTLITADQMTLAKAIRDSVYKNKAASALLGNGEPEATVVWENTDTGERCKARADWLRENVIVDVKTTIDARPDAFAKSIANYRYDVSTVHYEEGFDLNRYVFIAVEKDPPYGVAVYAADDIIRARGKKARDRNLRTYAECKAKNEWPCYEEIIQTIHLPRWATK